MINFQLVHFLGALRTLEALTAECAMKTPLVSRRG